MKNNDRLTSIIFGLVGLYIALQGYYLELGTLPKPKPGFLVFWAGIILFILSLFLFLKTFLSKYENGESVWRGVKWHRGVLLIVILIGYILLFQTLGFLVSTFLLLILLFKSMDSKSWKMAFFFSVAATIISFLIFDFFLEVQFPMGILKGWF
jgi:putative tricarboxylic transport membrane protein